MGQFSVTIYGATESVLSEMQQHAAAQCLLCKLPSPCHAFFEQTVFKDQINDALFQSHGL